MAENEVDWDVFLAYAGPDRHRADALHQNLVAAGIRVCFDQTTLEPGDNWHILLARWVRRSSIVVGLLSARSEDAHYQQSELVTAIEMVRRAGRRFVPVRLEPDAWLPYGTEQLHAVDMFNDADAAPLAARITALVDRRPTPAVPPSSPSLQGRTPSAPRFFTGRDEMLARLARTLDGRRKNVVTQAVYGLGGVGKPSLAAAFVERHRDRFDLVWWVRAEDPARLVGDLAELAPRLSVPARDDPAITAIAVRDALEQTDRRWLLVFDNVVDERSIDELFPRRGSGAVLITSRSTEFLNADEIIPLDVFPRDVAESFLRRRVEGRNPDAAAEPLDAVLDRLDGLPLALEQVGAWVARTPERRFGDFVRRYDDHAHDPFPAGTRPRGYEQTATTTWRISIDAATDEAPLAERVLAVVGQLAPERIPTAWLRAMGDDGYVDRAGAVAVEEALAALHAYSLVTITRDGTANVHRLVQAAVRRNPPGTEPRMPRRAPCSARSRWMSPASSTGRRWLPSHPTLWRSPRPPRSTRSPTPGRAMSSRS